ncbi:hypothetical protein [Streptomyces canus]|uniref:MmyB family transcriptional regulator n=1 Tax=Streptomyces canus TaxID=58343 RepID=UPI0036EE3A3D
MHQLLDAWAGTPACVRDRRFHVPAANEWVRALAPMYEPGHILARDVFLAPGARRLFPDWPEIAAQAAAALRAEADPGDPRAARDELKRFAHPVVGELALRRQALTVGGAEQQVIIVYQAMPGSPSEAALARLL